MSEFEHFYLHKDLVALNRAFEANGKTLRLVGGCVRDWLRGETPADVDLCTDATPAEMFDIAYDIETGGGTVNCIGTGIQHGTMTFVINHTPYEVTTLRIDVETDGRHAEVAFTTSFEEDAARRDLTINAMSMDFNGEIYDYFGGKEDLQKNVIRFVGNADARIKEDYLRILRYFRFAAKLSADPEDNTCDGTCAVIMEHAKGLKTISVERVWVEMQKLFVAPGKFGAIRAMEKYGVLDVLGLKFNYLVENANDAITTLWAMDGEKVNWKLSSPEAAKLRWLANWPKVILDEQAVNEAKVNGIPVDWIESWIRWNSAEADGLIEFAKTAPTPQFPISGYDLISLGMIEGREMGAALKLLKEKWVRSGFTKTKEELLT